MRLKVNGEWREIEGESLILKELLDLLGLDAGATGIAVAVNYEVISRSAWAETEVRTDDEIEIITARQGG